MRETSSVAGRYILLAYLGWLVFLAAGHPALSSLSDVISALSTVSLSAGIAGTDLPLALKPTLRPFMLLRRLEISAFLLLLNPPAWSLDAGRKEKERS